VGGGGVGGGGGGGGAGGGGGGGEDLAKLKLVGKCRDKQAQDKDKQRQGGCEWDATSAERTGARLT